MSIQHQSFDSLNASGAWTTQGDNAIDSIHHSFNQMTFNDVPVMEHHLFQHNDSYDQFQPNPHNARNWGRGGLALENGDLNTGRTYNPMISPVNYPNPVRAPCTSNDPWLYATASNNYWFYYYHDRLLQDQGTMNCDGTWGTQPSIPFSTTENEYSLHGGARPMEETNLCGTPDSSFSGALDHSPEQNQRVSANPCIGPSSPPPHVHTTSRPYKCKVRSCGVMFKRRAEQERHRGSVHQPTSRHPCPVAGCNRNNTELGFSRKDNLRQHLKLKHDHKFPKGRATARG